MGNKFIMTNPYPYPNQIMNSLQPGRPSNSEDDFEISILDIINFIQDSWKKIAIAAFVGGALSLTGWCFLGQYSAEYVLLNNINNNISIGINNGNSNSNSNSNNNNDSYALDIVSWKMLQKSLPNLADQIIDENKVPDNQLSLYKEMRDERWWQKNVTPSFALSKADARDLAGISKDLDTASTTILNLTLTANGGSKEQAIANVRAVSQFLRSGSAYLQIRTLLNSCESQTLSAAAELQQKITNTQIEMSYQVERAKGLEELRKRFPGNASVSSQVVDPKDSGAKYLPISTQIIAANNDINASKEAITRLQKRLAQIAMVKTFLDQAIPLQDQTFDGLSFGKLLMDIESGLRGKLAEDDINGREFLDQLHAQLLAIQVRFTKGLEANTAPSASKKGIIKTTAGGFAAAFFLMLLVLLGQRVCKTVKN
jgi:hypothetical protein